jgi:hypothetical protein
VAQLGDHPVGARQSSQQNSNATGRLRRGLNGREGWEFQRVRAAFRRNVWRTANCKDRRPC